MGLKNKAGLIALGSKLFGTVLKSAKLLKVLFAGAAFASYAVLLSWKFALLIMVAIGFHESGHVWAMKKMGIKTKGFYFLPFLGGAAIAEEQYKTYGQNSFIAIMGPIWGLFLSAIAAIVYIVTQQPFFAVVAAWMATLNLFNLLPIVPLDGGQLVRSIAFSIGNRTGLIFLWASLASACLLMYVLKIGLFVLILLVGALELFLEMRRRRMAKKFNIDLGMPSAMNKKQILMTAGSYVLTIALLFAIVFYTGNVPGSDIALKFLRD